MKLCSGHSNLLRKKMLWKEMRGKTPGWFRGFLVLAPSVTHWRIFGKLCDFCSCDEPVQQDGDDRAGLDINILDFILRFNPSSDAIFEILLFLEILNFASLEIWDFFTLLSPFLLFRLLNNLDQGGGLPWICESLGSVSQEACQDAGVNPAVGKP